ncbi:MAG: hypothetical protein COY39_02420 [Alphaproteobacteria bacterium CG_4_10_14_0_8_um_filter_37_21]|nr:MAG: hypothetical protein COY39_02420 [Alphaproteobacteria bacterium CG_4_10_14_0_8_um_filter_37_21]
MSPFQLPLDIKSLEIVSQSVDSKGNYTLEVKSTAKGTHCKKCGKWSEKVYGFGDKITVRHLSVFDKAVYLKIRVIRYQCESCDDGPKTSEKYDWMEQKSKTTKGLDEYISRQLINSTITDVSKKERLPYRVVESALHKNAEKAVRWSNYKDLTTLGIDEISLRKGHNEYVVIVSAKDKNGALSVIAVLPNRLKETTKEFLESIPDHLKKTVKSVCTDMYDGFGKSAEEVFGKRVVVIDRFHVSKLYREPLDALRIREMKRLKKELDALEYAKLDGMMWILRRNYECLSACEKEQLSVLYKHSPKLKEAHKHALKLTNIFNTHHNRKKAFTKITRWIAQVQKSTATCFNGFIKTLQKHKSGILNYFKERKNSGFVEGLNNKIKLLKRRCYSIEKVTTLFQRLVLDLKGYKRFA